MSAKMSHSMHGQFPCLCHYISKEDVIQHPIETKNYVDFEGVRITPKNIHFQDAFSGKEFVVKFSLQNVSLKPVNILVTPPPEQGYTMKHPIQRCMKLNPGVSLVRKLYYTHPWRTGQSDSCISITVNGNKFYYPIIVTTPFSKVTCIPNELDFGLVNVGYVAVKRHLLLRNSGSKTTKFSIDLGRNEFDVFVEPMKGTLMAYGLVCLRIEFIAKAEGEFQWEFWVKTEPLLCVKLHAKGTLPKMVPIHHNSTESFTLVAFPRRYFNVPCTHTFLVKNDSSTSSTFCVVAEKPVTHELVPLPEAKQIIPIFKLIDVSPDDGCMEPGEVKIFKITYTPNDKGEKLLEEKFSDFYCFCFVRIINVPFFDVPDKITSNYTTEITRTGHSLSISSTTTFADEYLQSLLCDNEISMECNEEILSSEKNYVRICFFGTAEKPNVSVRPSLLHFGIIPKNHKQSRELLITNHSNNLYIIYKYEQIRFIRMRPKSGILNPMESVEVDISLTPKDIGKCSVKFRILLLYSIHDNAKKQFIQVSTIAVPVVYESEGVTKKLAPQFCMGITPILKSEVGVGVQDVKFNDPIAKPRMAMISRTFDIDNALIAFPNDRPNTLRAWKSSEPCKTIVAKIPRYSNKCDAYAATTRSIILKKYWRNFYRDFIRQTTEEMNKMLGLPMPDLNYPITYETLHILKNFKCIDTSLKRILNMPPPSFIPLTPIQLHHIKITPMDITLFKIAPESSCPFKISIDNQNPFYLELLILPSKPVIFFPNGINFLQIQAFETMFLTMRYHAQTVYGRNNVVLQIIVNGSHQALVTVTAYVAPTILTIEPENIVFSTTSPRNYEFISILNPLNVAVNFSWDITNECFVVLPSCGFAAPRNKMWCMIQYNTPQCEELEAEVVLVSEMKRSKPLRVVVEKFKPNLYIESPVQLGDIPLNLPSIHFFFIRNLDEESVCFKILNPKLGFGIEITPEQGNIHGLSEKMFKITCNLNACISFNCNVYMELQKLYKIDFAICGRVIFPEINVYPSHIKISKINVFSYKCVPFKIENKSNCPVSVQFPLKDQPEYLVTAQRNMFSNVVISLALKAFEFQILYLFFRPVDVTTSYFYFPLVLNDILGPPIKGLPDTQKTSYYLCENEASYLAEMPHTVIEDIPKKLLCVMVESTIVPGMLKIAPSVISFKFNPMGDSTSVKQLKISNTGNETVKYCIRLDDLQAPFDFKCVSEDIYVESTEYSIVISMEPNEEAVFDAIFKPTWSGEISCYLPIVLRNFDSLKPFSYICINGIYIPPKIEFESRQLHLEPIPLKIKAYKSILVKTHYHLQDCLFTVMVEHSALTASLDRESISSEDGGGLMCLTVTFISLESICLNTDVIITCTCNASATLQVSAVAENCILTNHAIVTINNIGMPDMVDTVDPNYSTEVSSYSNVPVTKIDEVSNDEQHYDAPINLTKSPFPYFPSASDSYAYMEHMESTAKALEAWMNHQIFHFREYHVIPDGIAKVASPLPTAKKNTVKPAKKKKADEDSFRPYIKVLIHLAGKDVLKYIMPKEQKTKAHDEVMHYVNVYTNVLHYIQSLGGFLPHVQPQFLLEYKEYVSYTENTDGTCRQRMSVVSQIKSLSLFSAYNQDTFKILSDDMFYRRSKQCWMDLLLQTHKCLVLSRLSAYIGKDNDQRVSIFSVKKDSATSLQASVAMSVNKSPQRSNTTAQTDASSRPTDYKQSQWSPSSHLLIPIISPVIVSEEGNLMLRWLEKTYNDIRDELWGDQTSYKSISNFASDLSDGLCLAAVTAAYCPYLKPYLTGMQCLSSTPENILSNAITLIRTWEMVHLSFLLHPSDITHSNTVKLFMFCVFLHELLPSLYPEKETVISATISQKSEMEVTIKNISSGGVRYKIEMFENRLDMFSVATDFITIPPNKVFKIKVDYFAKSIDKAQAYMVLCGDCPGGNWGKSLAIRLIGKPTFESVEQEIMCIVPLYKTSHLTVNCLSPFKVEASYDIFFFILKDESIEKLLTDGVTPTNYLIARKIRLPKRIYLPDPYLRCNAEGVGKLGVVVTCFKPQLPDVMLIFRNSAVGDFLCWFKMAPNLKKKTFVTVEYQVPASWYSNHCSCMTSEGKLTRQNLKSLCPKMLHVPITCRNNILWKSIEESFLQILEPKEKEFWKNNIGTRAGADLLYFYLTDHGVTNMSVDLQHLFENTVTYNVKMEKGRQNSIILPNKFTIDNVASPETIDFPIHVLHPLPKEIKFSFESESGMELRFICVKLISVYSQAVFLSEESELEISDIKN